DVDVDFEAAYAVQIGLAGGVDIDIAHLRVDHPVVAEHIVGPDLGSQTPGVVQAEAVEVLPFGSTAELFVEEPGVIDAGADIGLERRGVVQRVVHHAQRWRQVLDAAQLAIQPGKAALQTGNAYVMAERGSRQQLDPYLVGDHVSKVQTQLSVAVQSGLSAQVAQGAMFDAGTVLTRINSDRAGADNDVTGLVGLGDGSRQQSGNKQQAGGESGYSA